MGHLLPQHHYISVKRGERGYDKDGNLQQSMPFDSSNPSDYRNSEGIVYNVGSPSMVFGNGPRFTLQEAIKWYYKCVGIRLEIATDTFANYDFPITNKTTKAHKFCESMLLKDDNITSLSFADALTDGTMNYWAFSPTFDFVTQTNDEYAFVRYEHGETDLGQFSVASGAAFTGDPTISIARKFFTRGQLGAATSASIDLIVYDTVNVPPDPPETRVFTLDLSSDKVAISSFLTLDSSVSSTTQTSYTVPAITLGSAGSFNFSGNYANAAAFAAVINDFNDTYEDIYEIESFTASTFDNSITRRTRTFEGVNYYQLYNPTHLDIVHKLND
jgi:hypothetical protein